jgi:hypothetical protein
VSAIEPGTIASKAAIQRSGVDPGDFDHVIFGNVLQTSADAIYGARHVGLKAGLKVETPAVTVNRLCGSGIEAIVQASQRLLLGEATMVLAGGMENMTQAPFVIRGARTGLKLGGGVLEDFLFVGLTDSYCGLPMALTAEKLAEQAGITRQDSDAYALRSQQAADAAYKAGFYKEEIAAVEVKQGKKTIVVKSFRDGFLPYTGAAVKECFEELKKTFVPDVIFTHFRHDLHQDHRLVCELTWNTFRNHLIFEYEIPKYDADLRSPNFFASFSIERRFIPL